MRISDWSSDVCSSDLSRRGEIADRRQQAFFSESFHQMVEAAVHLAEHVVLRAAHILEEQLGGFLRFQPYLGVIAAALEAFHAALDARSEERCLGKEGVCTCSTRCSLFYYIKKY